MRIAFLLHAVALVACAELASAQGLPLGSRDFTPSVTRPFGWRGDGSGRFLGATPPTVWSMAKNLRWSTPVGSAYSSPILTDRLVFAASEPNLLICLDRTDGKLIAVHVDPSDPTAWRREPYFQELKQFAIRGVEVNQRVIVYIKNRVIVIFPNKEVEVGTIVYLALGFVFHPVVIGVPAFGP